MTEQEKKIMLIDLCARLPYGVKGKVETTDGNGKEIKDEGVLNGVYINEYGAAYICIEGMEYELEDVKPYLRPMSSMTKDEEETECYLRTYQSRRYADFCYSKHLDYRGLIEKGLALPAPNEMYNIK